MKDYAKLKAKRFNPTVLSRGGNTTFFEKVQEKPLVGEINGLKATQGEERFARMLNKGMGKGIVRGYYFRYSPEIPRNVVGWKELDYLVDAGGRIQAIAIDGEGFVHKSAASKSQDLLNDLIILARLKDLGYDIPEIKHIPAENLTTQADTDKIGRDLGLYR